MVKLIALLLGIGGIAGAGVCVWTCAKLAFYQSQPVFSRATALLVVFATLFGLCSWTGIELWKNRPRAYKWAELLLALQIPTITIPGFAYQFYTGILLLVSWNHSDGQLGFGLEIASLIDLKISSSIEDYIFGINLIALAALIYLLCIPNPKVIPEPKSVIADQLRDTNSGSAQK